MLAPATKRWAQGSPRWLELSARASPLATARWCARKRTGLLHAFLRGAGHDRDRRHVRAWRDLRRRDRIDQHLWCAVSSGEVERPWTQDSPQLCPGGARLTDAVQAAHR